jgi:tetratricopeptide (TPR) repeat protein
VSPNEIPALERQLTAAPDDGDLLLRYAAALYAAEQCDSARVVARKGMAAEPAKALGPLVLGQCLEQVGELEEAVAVYGGFLAAHPDRPGSSAVRARQSIARRERAVAVARSALAREAELAEVPAEPTTLAVLPIDIVGDSVYAPLSRGLAELLATDLALLQRFRMVERLQVGALLSEMELTQAGRVDATTAVRLGRMLRAGRMVQGLATIPPRGTTRLEATVVMSTGEVLAPARQSGKVKDLLDMEKELVVDIARQLGYQLSQAELQLILESGTRNLAAFLAFSRGLEAEDRGDYQAASQHYAEAVRADPGFDAAREAYQTSVAAPDVVQAEPAAVTVLASAPPTPTQPLFEPPLGDPLSSAVVDVASTQAEAASPTTAPVSTGTTTAASQPPPTVVVIGTTTITGVVRIIFRLP